MTLATSQTANWIASSPISRSELLEAAKRERARRRLLHFTKYTFPGYRVNWHHEAMCTALDRFVAGEIKRLIILMPPRHGKSEQVSRRLPAFILGHNPDAQIITASYGADLASLMNRDVQRIMDSPRYFELFPGTRLYGKNIRTQAGGSYLRNSDIFEVVNHTGFYRSAGVGGGITGMGFHYGIIDDPFKNRKEANSPTVRQAVWDWYASTFYTRQEDDASILITMTPWHPDDLAGRLLKQAKEDPEADQWVVIRFPAIAEAPVGEGDPRQPGEALWPGKYDEKKLARIKAAIGLYEWNALYQVKPRAPEGALIKREWFEVVEAVPAYVRRVRYWDKAGTQGDGAYTCGVLLAISEHGVVYVEDVVRGQWGIGERESMIRLTAELDAQKYHGKTAVRIYVEQEPGSAGKESAQATIKRLAGFIVEADPPTGEKAVRLEPFAAQAQAGNVKLVKGAWIEAWLAELTAVPFCTYWDQADATSGAFNKLVGDAREAIAGTAPGQLGTWRG